MKKFATCCLLATAAAGIIFAASDKIYLANGGYVFKAIPVDDVENITYTKDNNASADFTGMKVDFKNGSSQTLDLKSMSSQMVYYHALPDCSVSMEVTPRYESAKLTVTAPDENTYYRITGYTEKELTEQGIDESIWGEILVQADIADIKAVAEYYGQPLSYFSPDQIFEKGSQVRDWFPGVIISDNTPIVLAIYTAVLEGDEVVPTSEPTVIRFTTKKLEIKDVDFTITADLTSNSITAKADAPEGFNEPMYVTLFSESDFESKGLDRLIPYTVGMLEQTVYSAGGPSWDEVTPCGHVENTFSNLVMGDVYYAVAFGCDYGIVTTSPKYVKFTVPAPEITDDCTFEVEATQQSPSEFSLNIKPSKTTTRYAGMLIESSKLNETNTPEMAVAKKIWFLNSTNTLHWDDSELIYSGEKTISSYSGLIDGKYLNIGTEYKALIFGVDETGTRTTEIKAVDIIPTQVAQNETAFDVTFGEFNGSSSWTHYLPVTITPTDAEAKYVFAYLPEGNASINLDWTDEEFINNYVGLQGEYLELHTGVLNKTMSFSSKWDSAAGAYAFGTYYAFLFGYDGAATTPLYLYKIDTATGTVEQIRGASEQEQMTFAMTKSAINASSKWSHYLPVTVTPSDMEGKYVFNYLPEGNASINLDWTDEEFISNYVGLEGEWLELHTGVLNKTMSFASSWDSAAADYVFKPYYLFVFGYDGAATTPLYLYKVDSATGDIEQLRGPEAPFTDAPAE